MVPQQASNDELWLELLKKNLEDLRSVKLVHDKAATVSRLEQSIRTRIAELEAATSSREILRVRQPDVAYRLRWFQLSTCVKPTKALLRQSRSLIRRSRQRLTRVKALVAGLGASHDMKTCGS